MGLISLDQLAIANKADKASSHHVKGHNYARHYDKLFSPFRLEPIKLLEIGVGGGESIRTWLDYFPNAKVVGADIVGNTNPWNTPDSGVHERYRFIHGNQSDPNTWNCKIMAEWGGHLLNVCIDDGGHFSGDIISTFIMLWSSIDHGGIYCVEDTGVTYTTGTIFHTPGFPTHSEWIKSTVEEANRGGSCIDSMHIFEELIAIVKQ